MKVFCCFFKSKIKRFQEIGHQAYNSLSVSHNLSFCLCLYLCLSVSVSVCLSLCLSCSSFSLLLSQSLFLSVCPPPPPPPDDFLRLKGREDFLCLSLSVSVSPPPPPPPPPFRLRGVAVHCRHWVNRVGQSLNQLWKYIVAHRTARLSSRCCQHITSPCKQTLLTCCTKFMRDETGVGGGG